MRTYKEKTISSIKIFGGKSKICKRIVEKMIYKPIMVEGFCGASNVSLSIDEKFDRHYCVDLNRDLINFWKILQLYPDRLYKFLLHTDYCEENFQTAKKYLQDNKDEIIEPFFHASMFMIRNRMSRGADNKTYGWSDRLRRGQSEYISAYTSAIDNLLNISNKIKNINFVCDDYMLFMIYESLNERSDVVQYIDPPYTHESRTECRPYGQYELPTFCRETTEGCSSHECLISFLKTGIAGITYLSGYDSPEYSKWLENYEFYQWEVSNSASQSKSKPKMKELLWEIS